MDIEQQVPTLELCRKLEELGYPQEGLFWWSGDDRSWSISGSVSGFGAAIEGSSYVYESKEICLAPTVAELGEWLPTNTQVKLNWRQGHAIATRNILKFGNNIENEGNMTIVERTEANARAKMLIWLAENKYVDFSRTKGGKE